jgi:hypothetical protein
VVVRFRCDICHRSGPSRLARLAQKHGCEATLGAVCDELPATVLGASPVPSNRTAVIFLFVPISLHECHLICPGMVKLGVVR